MDRRDALELLAENDRLREENARLQEDVNWLTNKIAVIRELTR